jgi:hypothetical protein
LASNEDGTNLLGLKEGRRGYRRQIPNELNVVGRVSLSVKRPRRILEGIESDETSSSVVPLRSSAKCSQLSKDLGIRLLGGAGSSMGSSE